MRFYDHRHERGKISLSYPSDIAFTITSSYVVVA
jgi:hypothetical protein